MRIRISCKAEIDRGKLAVLRKAQTEAFAQTAKDVADDLKASETLPYRTGALEESTREEAVDGRQNAMQIATRVPYAALVYNRTDVRYLRAFNEEAGPLWFEPYVRGAKVRLWAERFGERLRALLAERGKTE